MATPLLFPPNPVEDQKFTGTNNIVYVYDGAKWTSVGATVISSDAASVGTNAPASPLTGTLWYDTGVSRLKVWYNGSWKDVRPNS